VLQKYYEYEASLQKIPQAGSLSDPELTAGVFLSPMELVTGNQVADIRLMQMFPWFGVLKNAKDEMSLMAKARYESFRDEKFQVLFDVQKVWYELHKIGNNIRISEENLAVLHTLERLTLVRYKTVSTVNPSSGGAINASPQANNPASPAMNNMGGNPGPTETTQPPAMQGSSMGSSSGVTSLADLYRIQVEIGNLENNIALLNNQIITIKAKFNAYLNRPANAPVFISDTLKADTAAIVQLAETDTMLTTNPMLRMIDYEQQSLDARERMVTRMGYPMIGAGINYSLINRNKMSASEMNGRDMLMPMVTITLPIYRKKYKAMQTETALMKTANSQAYKAVSNGLQTQYYEAIQAYQDAERRIKLFKHQRMLTKKSLDIMLKSFSASTAGAGLTDILSIQQQLLDYEFKQIEALADYNTSIAWIRRLTAKTDNQ
ncbi:MAG: TolC family protein, partial [Bacteroidales bacterium]|nr:TolC family protein [Bacteroidales bacterium]